jgi:FkbM family methyltransferase
MPPVLAGAARRARGATRRVVERARRAPIADRRRRREAEPPPGSSDPLIDSYFAGGFEPKRGMTVVDVGANVGLFSLAILRRTQGHVRLLALEPAPETFALLEQNVRKVPGGDVRLHRTALGAEPGEAVLYYRPRASAMSSLYRESLDTAPVMRAIVRDAPAERRRSFPRWMKRLPTPTVEAIMIRIGDWSQAKVVETPCPVTTISDILLEHAIERVDFLKVDVEGAELDVLRGVRPSDWPKIQWIAAEVHDFDGRVQTVRELLQEAGFESIRVSQHWPFTGSNIYMVEADRLERAESGVSPSKEMQ